MKSSKGFTFIVLNGAAEVCWLYAIAAFAMAAINHGAFPFTAAVTVCTFSAILTGISHGRGWRVIWAYGLQFVGIMSAFFWGTYLTHYSSFPLADTGWLHTLFNEDRTPIQWTVLVLTNVWIALFWVTGRALVLRKREYYTVCSRFDIGLAAFFCLLICKLVLLHKAGLNVQDPYSFSLVFPFFLISLLLIGMSRIEHHSPKSFLPGYRSVGIIAAFITVVLLYSGAMFLFFLPFLHAAADTGYRVLKGGAGFLLPVVETILRFVFMGRRMREEPAQQSPSHDDSISSMSQGPVSEFFERIMKWGIEGLIGILILLGCCIAIYFFVKWLLSRTEHITGEKRGRRTGPFWVIRLWNALVLWIRGMLARMRGYNTASEFYAVLGEWGSHSGCTRSRFETPLEFRGKLNVCFPSLSTHFNVIVGMFQKEFYAEQILSAAEIREIRTAWRRLRSPRYWFARAKVRLFRKEYD